MQFLLVMDTWVAGKVFLLAEDCSESLHSELLPQRLCDVHEVGPLGTRLPHVPG